MMTNEMKYFIVPQPVKVRKYPVDIERLKQCLQSHRIYSNIELSERMSLPVTKVEHWFRKGDFFAIPDPEIWFELKEILGITTDEFDKSIMEFEERDGVYDKNERCYLTDYLCPTLTCHPESEKFIVEEENG